MSTAWSIKTLLESMAARGEQAALIAIHANSANEWSFAQIAGDAQRLAQGLLSDGLEPGEPVAIFAPNMPEWVVAALAVGAAGGTMVPIDALSSNSEVSRIVADSGSRRVFTTTARLADLRQLPIRHEIDFFLLDTDQKREDARSWKALLNSREIALPEVTPDAHASLFYTSGTTGIPKAFYLSYANIGVNVDALSNHQILQAGDRALLPLPFHHAYPWIAGVLTSLGNGVPVILPESADGPHIMTALRVGRPTVIVGVPRLYEALLAGIQARLASRSGVARAIVGGLWTFSIWLRRHTGRLAGRWLMRPIRDQIGPGIRLMVSGGARLDAQYVRKLEGLGWEVLSGYGLAETASLFTGNLPLQKKIGSEGKPIAGGMVRIDSPDDAGVGEIQIKGPNVFSGYHNNADANAEAFSEEGWFRTGDLGYLDDEGFLYVTGRAKEVIVLGGGKNVYPEEVEKAYAPNPQIREIAVLERNGSLVGLVVPDLAAIKAAGALQIDDAIKVALTSVAQHLPSFHRLAGFAIAHEPLPKTRLGKYRRYLLPRIYERALSGDVRPKKVEMSEAGKAFLAMPPARDIWTFLEKRFPDHALNLETNPQLDLGLDSFEWMTLSVELEDKFDIRLTETEIARIETLRDLVNEALGVIHASQTAQPDSADVVARDRERWLRPTNAFQTLLGHVLLGVNRLLLRTMFKLRAIGVERLPDRGPFIIAPNHISDLDPLVIAAALPIRTLRQTYWAADVVRVFSNSVSRFFCRVARIFPVDERKPLSVISMGKAVLDKGNVLVWFPEGWRSPDGKLLRFQAGIGMLLKESGAPVIPAYISGAFEAWPRDRRWPRPHPVQIVFGNPIGSECLRDDGVGRESHERVAALLRTKVADLGRSVGADV
jgi:long-chain acyl-CoA synthetase